jgi:hypothetical protein
MIGRLTEGASPPTAGHGAVITIGARGSIHTG